MSLVRGGGGEEWRDKEWRDEEWRDEGWRW